jgi:hypothetical protein
VISVPEEAFHKWRYKLVMERKRKWEYWKEWSDKK